MNPVVGEPGVVEFDVPGAQGLESGFKGWREEHDA